MIPAYDSPSSIKTFLELEGLAMSKRFGQNFLVDRNAREKLYASLQAEPHSPVWEIGPGIGSMTSLLLAHGHPVSAFEIDYGFARVLKDLFGTRPHFNLIEGDFIKTWKSYISDPSNRPALIFGNLPYNAALAIIADLLEYPWIPPAIIFTVQKEAAQRIVSKPGTKDYSAFSVLCSSVCEGTVLYDIGASAFWPQPRVISSVVSLVPRKKPIASEDRLGFSRFVRGAFSSRRKTLRNNLQAIDKSYIETLDQVLLKLQVPLDIRAEALSPEQLAEIFFFLKERA
jgi:16S rRNA (adenine1518-N6/adenine1519-N6)-dimethyltransferase